MTSDLPQPIAFDPLVNIVGRRYAACRLDNWEYAQDRRIGATQRAIVSRLRRLCQGMESALEAGQNVLLWGPVGTGKDHLLAAILRAAYAPSRGSILWTSGADLWGRLRDAIDGEAGEATQLRRLTGPAVLAISDPVPPGTRLTEFQAAWLYRIIDGRYRMARSTWVTLNVLDRADAEGRLTPQVWDRLRDGAIVCNCDWPSYRAPKENVR